MYCGDCASTSQSVRRGRRGRARGRGRASGRVRTHSDDASSGNESNGKYKQM